MCSIIILIIIGHNTDLDYDSICKLQFIISMVYRYLSKFHRYFAIAHRIKIKNKKILIALCPRSRKLIILSCIVYNNKECGFMGVQLKMDWLDDDRVVIPSIYLYNSRSILNKFFLVYCLSMNLMLVQFLRYFFFRR